jgi:hypothetical protein
MEDRGKWSYMMSPSIDDKKYATDSRSFKEAYIEYKIDEANKIQDPNRRKDVLSKIGFEDSPISSHLSVKDVCIYKPGDLNKIGKEGKTSWDSFSYALQMGHNVWMHIESTQRANRCYDANQYPYMLIEEKFDKKLFRNIVDEIFSLKDRSKSLELIDKHSRFWMQVIGTRLNVGKKTVNALTNYQKLLEEEYAEITEELISKEESDRWETKTVKTKVFMPDALWEDNK